MADLSRDKIWHDLGPKFMDNFWVYWVTSTYTQMKQSIETIEHYVAKHNCKYAQRYTLVYSVYTQYTQV